MPDMFPAKTTPDTPVPPDGRGRDALWALALALPQLLLPLLLGAFHGAPLNDSWSYARAAESLARTGHLTYNGWGSPMLLPQAAIGALIIAAFGFSYASLAWFGAACAATTAALLFLLARACGCSRATGAAVTALVTLNPIFLGVGPTFMTEAFSLLLLLASLLVLVRSLRPEGRRVVPAWGALAASAALGLLAGANRQLLWGAWLGSLLALAPFVPARDVLRRLLPAGLAVAVAAGALSLWFSRQPYVVFVGYTDGLGMLSQAPLVSLLWAYRALTLLGLLVFPLAAATVLARGRPIRWLLFGAVLIFCLFPLVFLYREAGFDWMFRPTFTGQYFTERGVLIGETQVPNVPGLIDRPVALPPPIPGVLTLLGAVGMALGFYLFLEWLEDVSALRRESPAGAVAPTVREAAALTAVAASGAAQLLASLLWYMSGNVFDRYHLLIWPGLLILHGRQLDLALAGRGAPDARGPVAVPLLSARRMLVGLFVGLIGVFGLTFAQEYFAYTRARAELFRRLTDRGVARKEIDGGFEWNADTQVLEEGRTNHPSVANPPGAHDPARTGTARFLAKQFPVVVAQYRLSPEYPPTIEETGLVDPEPLDRAEYASLLPPSRRAVYLYRVRTEEETAALAATGRLPGQP